MNQILPAKTSLQKTHVFRILFLTLILVGISCGVSSQNTVGVLQYQPDSTFEGYMLLAPFTGKNTYLIDNCGREINRWEGNLNPAASTYFLENGKLLRTERDTENPALPSTGGGGYVKLYDWEGTEEWSFHYSDSTVRLHHDIEYMPNGNILMIAWHEKTLEEAIAAGRNPELLANPPYPTGLWSEHIIEVDRETNNIVWEWHVWDHLIQDIDSTKNNYGAISEHPELIDINGGPNAPDFIHFNSIAYNAELDQIVLSAHQYSEIWIIDHSTTTAEAATGEGGNSGKGGDLLYRWGNPQKYGHGSEADRKFFFQHDAHWISSGPHAGKIMVFNNGQGRPCPEPCNGFSSVEIINTPLNENGTYDDATLPFLPDTYDWRYVDPVDSLSFYSPFISGAQMLSNGNVLICSGAHGNMFEINAEHETVWEYQNPFTFDTPLSQGDAPLQASGLVFRAYKYTTDYSGFDGLNPEPGDYLELNPDTTHCVAGTSGQKESGDFGNDILVFPNPIVDEVQIDLNQTKVDHIDCLDINGKIVSTISVISPKPIINTMNWPTGIYLLKLVGEEGFTVKRIVKNH